MLPTPAAVEIAMQLSASGGLTFGIALHPGDWLWLCLTPAQHLLDLRTATTVPLYYIRMESM